MEDGKLDVKVAFLGNPFEVYTYPLLHVNPDILAPEASEGKNITYHHGGGGKDVVIHLKNDLAGEGEPRYKDLPLHRILPPSTDSLVPLPLLKLELPRTLGPQGPKPRKRKNKPGKRTVDIDTDCDVVEIFMTSREWSIGDMQAMLPDLMGTLLTTPFEAWASNSITVNQSKAAVIPHGEGKSRLIGVKFDQVDLVVLQYPQPFMPTPDVIRVTFIENELAEPIMLHMQSFFTKDGCHCLTRCPKLDDILMPDYMRVHNLKHQDVWVRALRFNLMARQQYDLLAHRVDRGRLDLVLSIRARDAELESAIASTRESVERVAGDGAIGAAVDSFGRHVALAREIGALPAFIHSTRLSNESLGVDEDYAFLTIGGDIDVHFDIARLCDLAGVPAKEMMMRTEGRPFEDGLAGLRTHLKLMGYRCSATTTFVLIEPEGPESLPVAVPLYEADVLSGQYRSLPEGEREKLHEMVGGDLRAYLAHLYAGFPLEAGPYVLEITSSEEVDGKVCHKTRVAGRIDDALWDEVSRPARSFISAYRDIRRAFLELDRSYEEFVAKCAKENVERMASKRGDGDAILADAESAAVCLGMIFGRLLGPIASFLQVKADPEDLGEVPGVDPWQTRCFAILCQLAMYALNSRGVFSGVKGSIGVGEWLWCDKRRMLAWDGWSEGNRGFLESITGDHVDLERIAADAYSFAADFHDRVLSAKPGELVSICAAYCDVRDKYGIRGDMVVFRVHESAAMDDAIFADHIDLRYLQEAIDGFEAAQRRLASRQEDAGSDGPNDLVPVRFDVEDAEGLLNRSGGVNLPRFH